jgi:hypothetical protein
VAFRFRASAVFIADADEDAFWDCAALALRSCSASALSSSCAAAAARFSSCRMVWLLPLS